MRKYEDSVSSAVTGLPVYQAEISIFNADLSPAQLYADEGVTPLAQPVLTDGLGRYSFFVADGTYTRTVAGPGGINPVTDTELEIYEDARNVSVPVGEAGVALPSVGARAGKLLGFDAGGEPVAYPADSFAVTVEMEELRDEAAASATSAATSAGNASDDADEAALSAAAALASAADAERFANSVGRAFKAADTSIASSTTLVADANLFVSLGANSLTVINGYIDYTANTTGDLKWQHAGPAAPVSVRVDRKALAPGDTAYSGIVVDTAYSAGDIVVDGVTGSGLVEFKATIRNGPTAGNFNFKWAQNTSNATATVVKAGSYLEYFRLPSSGDFTFANASVAKLGDYTTGVNAGHNFAKATNTSGILNSYFETMVTGTACDLQALVGNFTITIDNGTPFVVAAPAGWTFVNLFTGLAEGAHRLKIKPANDIAVDTDIMLRVTGVAPDIARPSDVPNRFRIYDATNSYATYIAKDGAPDPYTGNYGAGDARVAVQSSASGFGVRFSATTTSVRAWIYDGSANSQHILLKDGVATGTPYTYDGTGAFKLVTFATGLSGSHEYEIQAIHSGKQSYIFAVYVDALDAVAHSAWALDAYYGDSIVAMQVAEDARTHDGYILARGLGRACTRKGVGGTGVSVDASGNQAVKYGRDNTAGITNLSQAPTRIFVQYGVNDLFFTVPLATFEADYTTMLANLRAGNAGAKIYARGILPQYRNLDADRQLYNARISAAVAARVTAGDANVVYINTDGWISVTPGVDLRDNVHPNASGYAKIAAAQALVL